MRWIIFFLFITFMDLFTKQLARVYLTRIKVVKIIPNVLSLSLVENRGIAFGLFDGSIPPKVILGVSGFFIIFFLFLLLEEVKRKGNYLSFCYSLIIGGSLGNFIERLLRGRVTDFIDLHYKSLHWPTFNLADTAITIGAILFFLKPLIKKS